MPLEIDLSQKIVVVTGASSGMGAEIAVTVARAGAAVIIVGRDESRLKLTRDAVLSVGGRCAEVLVDLNLPDAPTAVVRAALDNFGGLTTVVHSAAVFASGPAIKSSVDELTRLLEVNVRAPYALTVAALPHLRASTGASVIFIGSVSGGKGFPDVAGYSSSKGALESLVRSLAVEEGPHGIRVACVVSGTVRTPMTGPRFADPGFERRATARVPLGRLGEVSDIAPAVAFLASDLACYVTGVSFPVDGGVLAG